MKTKIETWLFNSLGSEWCGNTTPPGDHIRFDMAWNHLAITQNDGFELWLGTPNEWLWHCKFGEARRLAWFILWDWWAKGTWFGCRSWLWYKLLSRRVSRHRMNHPEFPDSLGKG